MQNYPNFIEEAFAIEAEEAKKAGALGFMARALVQATIPHSKVQGNEYERHNGSFKLTILAPSSVGLPYGTIPRMLIAWITTESILRKERNLVLSSSLSKFMCQLDLIPTGGRWGSITRLREQMKRLFSSSISCTYDNKNSWAIKNVQPVSYASLWWDPKSPEESSLFQSTITLSEEFFNEIINCSIPIDMRALKVLKKSPMAIDIYCWLTYRMSYLKSKTSIPWEVLQIQFGSNYTRARDFKKYFIHQLKSVLTIYPSAKVEEEEKGLILKPSFPHILT